MEQMEVNNMYINMGVNNSSEKWTEKTLRASSLTTAAMLTHRQ